MPSQVLIHEGRLRLQHPPLVEQLIENDTLEVSPVCVECGYDLRTLPIDVHCPECGTAVWSSRTGRLLRYADGRWLRRLHRGLAVLRGCRKAMWVVVGMMSAAVIALVYLGGPVHLWLLYPLLALVVLVVSAHAWPQWLVSSPEPGGARIETREHAAYRALSVAVVPLLIGWASLSFILVLPRYFWVRQIVDVLCMSAVWSLCFLTVREVRRLQNRCAYRLTGTGSRARLVLAVPPILYLLHWIGPFRLWATGTWGPPVDDGVLIAGMAFVWFAINDRLLTLRKPIAREIEAADADAAASTMPST